MKTQREYGMRSFAPETNSMIDLSLWGPAWQDRPGHHATDDPRIEEGLDDGG